MPLKGRPEKIAYSLASIGLNGYWVLISTFLIYFLIDIVHLDPWLSALAFSLSYGVWNAMNDIIVGVLSDRTRTRFGRRRPWIMIGAPLCLLFYVLVWSPPLGGVPLTEPWALGIFFFLLIVIASYEFTYSMVVVAWLALFPEMWESVEDRSEVVIYRQIFATVGAALAIAVFPLLVSSFSRSFGVFGGWTWAGGILGAICSGAFLLSLLGTRERKEFASDKPLPIAESLKMTLSNKTFLKFEGVDLMSWCMVGWLTAMTPFFIEHSLGMETESVIILLGPQMLGTIVSFVVWRKFYLRYGPKVIMATSTTALSLVFALCLVIQTSLQVAVFGLLIGIAVAGSMIARNTMIGDVVDEDEVNTGVRREGSYFGVSQMVQKISMVITGASTAFVLSTIIGYIPGEPEPEFMNMGIRLSMAGFTALYTAVLLVLLKFYPLGKQRVAEISRKISKMHAEKTKKL